MKKTYYKEGYDPLNKYLNEHCLIRVDFTTGEIKYNQNFLAEAYLVESFFIKDAMIINEELTFTKNNFGDHWKKHTGPASNADELRACFFDAEGNVRRDKDGKEALLLPCKGTEENQMMGYYSHRAKTLANTPLKISDEDFKKGECANFLNAWPNEYGFTTVDDDRFFKALPYDGLKDPDYKESIWEMVKYVDAGENNQEIITYYILSEHELNRTTHSKENGRKLTTYSTEYPPVPPIGWWKILKEKGIPPTGTEVNGEIKYAYPDDYQTYLKHIQARKRQKAQSKERKLQAQQEYEKSLHKDTPPEDIVKTPEPPKEKKTYGKPLALNLNKKKK